MKTFSSVFSMCLKKPYKYEGDLTTSVVNTSTVLLIRLCILVFPGLDYPNILAILELK